MHRQAAKPGVELRTGLRTAGGLEVRQAMLQTDRAGEILVKNCDLSYHTRIRRPS